ncbi:MAG: ATP-binding cassette domain-containing protein [Candidatus Bathyarchaeia archaeon]|jgi:peptide/nickel transport system ATP-binding protein
MNPLLEVDDLTKKYSVRREIIGGEPQDLSGVVTAVDSVTFTVSPGETVGIVGQSGSGKTTLGKLILKLEAPTSGHVKFDGEDLSSFRGRKLKNFRAKVQMIFQDPYGSLDPRMSIRETLEEPLIVHGIKNSNDKISRIDDALIKVGMTPPQRFHGLRPHQLSGGQRQRIAIARALILNPQLIVADEPVSMLDVSVSAEILNLMLELRQLMNIAYVFITHNLAHAAYFCDSICVMNKGRIVEKGLAEKILRNPQDEYTKTLIASIPANQQSAKQGGN